MGNGQNTNQKPNKFYVYYHMTPTGRIFYIGKGFARRALQVRGRNNYWRNLVAKFNGLFVSCILSDNLSETQAFDEEMEAIKYFRENNPGWLVNMSEGGPGSGKRKKTEAEIRKLRRAHSKPVFCFQTGVVYESATQAAVQLNLCQTAVSLCCNKKAIQTKGYQFIYFNEGNSSAPELKPPAKNKKAGIPVISLVTGQHFKSYYEAGKALNIHPSTVGAICQKKRKDYSGYDLCHKEKEKP